VNGKTWSYWYASMLMCLLGPTQIWLIAVHNVPLNEESIPIKKKLRRTRPAKVIKVKAEIEKQWDASFLEVVRYP
jgi:hypothetical protein